MDNASQLDPAIAALINNPGDAGSDVSDGTFTGREAAIDVRPGQFQHIKTGESPSGSGLKTADLRGLVPEPEPVEPGTELARLVAERMTTQAEYEWVTLKGNTLEEFISALQQLPKNEIQLQSITRVGFHVATKKLAFYRPQT